jgi:hypothetical protein
LFPNLTLDLWRIIMQLRKLLLGAALLAAFGVHADNGGVPGWDPMAPGSKTVGAPNYGKSGGSSGSSSKPTMSMADKNGDGFLDKSELDPDSQLYKRFATRDKDGDGKLGPDEYFMMP